MIKTLFGFLISTTASASTLTMCPAVLLATGCGQLLTITSVLDGVANGYNVENSDPPQPPVDGVADVMIGVTNAAGATVDSIYIVAPPATPGNLEVFALDQEGPCFVLRPAIIPCSDLRSSPGSSFAGPGTFFSDIALDATSGRINFVGGLADGGSLWFGLKAPLPVGDPSPTTGNPEPGTAALMVIGVAGIVVGARRAKRGV